MNESMKIRQYLSDTEVTENVRRALADCWVAVTNAGGAAGFPFPPVDGGDVAPVLERLVGELHADRCRLLTAVDDRGLLGWLVLRRSLDPLIAHRGSLHHVQSHPNCRGEGVGSFLMHHAREIARDEVKVEQLHLAARAGVGLETFYGRLGWREIGRRPGALRLAPEDDRDEILMHLGPL
ncbi:GNAT family N-acetyltransferase [Haloactinomyces albus]|uniref:GNAT superfamily N-acetyltransferase n=1 Tax=Haloactinomyces albus TaxID=1352928 RepID=A0AAE4CKE9_9ACTN|nr:GNAT family N-acetyltransferase [Haloactinomyces albus]MDR7300654.1 GNAT superfamily N-acetyltransferase [Haloactinomyces albus]